jgi:hypothetical protein
MIAIVYEKLKITYHPDKFASKSKVDQAAAKKKLDEIMEAYDCICTPDRRRAYDEWRRSANPSSPPPRPAPSVPPPQPSVSPRKLDFGTLNRDEWRVLYLSIDNVGGPVTGAGENVITLERNEGYITLASDQTEGFPIKVTVTLDTCGLAPGDLVQDTIVVKLDGVAARVPITAHVRPVASGAGAPPVRPSSTSATSASPWTTTAPPPPSTSSTSSSGSPPGPVTYPTFTSSTPAAPGMGRGWAVVLGWTGGIVFYQVLSSLLSAAATARGVQSSAVFSFICGALILISSVLAGIGITNSLRKNPTRGGRFAWSAAITAFVPFLLVFTVGGNRPVNYPRIDELDGKSLGVPSGITWVHAIGDRGASFSAANSSRIEFPNLIPAEGTLEFWINIKDGYHYDNYRLLPNQNDAMIFSSDVQGGDVTWPGTTKIFVSRDGKLTLWVATSKYDKPNAIATEAAATSFRFGEWHAVGFSYGSLGQYIMLDGKLVASAPGRTQSFGTAGNHNQRLDVPTIGETVSHFWAHHRYEGGFEGTLAAFRVSGKQEDWQIAEGVTGNVPSTVVATAPISVEDQREHDLVNQAQQLFAAQNYNAALSACNEALTLNAGDDVAIKLKHDIEDALKTSNTQPQGLANSNSGSLDSPSAPSAVSKPGAATVEPSVSTAPTNLTAGAKGLTVAPLTNGALGRMRADTGAIELLSLVQSAMGGKDRLAGIRDWQRQATETWLPNRGTTRYTVSFAEPSTVREETLGGNRVINFSNGRSGWTWSSTAGPARDLPSPTATGMAFRVLPDLVLSNARPGRTVRLLSLGTLEISDENHNSVRLTIDLNSHLPQKIAWTNLDGATLEETYSDWRPINGTLWWFHMTRSREGAVFLQDQAREYRINNGITAQSLAAQPDQMRRPNEVGSVTSTAQPLVIQTDADRRGTLMLFKDHIEYRDEGMGTNGGKAPYGPNPENNFSLSCFEIENLKSYGFRPVLFGSFQVVISAHKKSYHIPALHGDSVVKSIQNRCGLVPSNNH